MPEMQSMIQISKLAFKKKTSLKKKEEEEQMYDVL